MMQSMRNDRQKPSDPIDTVLYRTADSELIKRATPLRTQSMASSLFEKRVLYKYRTK